MKQTVIVPADMKVLMNYIYEYQKGIRQLVLYTFNKKYEQLAITRLENQHIKYIIRKGGDNSINLFFGREECLSAIQMIVDRPLCDLTPEEDFMLGVLLGYDIRMQCERYCDRKCKHCSKCKDNVSQVI